MTKITRRSALAGLASLAAAPLAVPEAMGQPRRRRRGASPIAARGGSIFAAVNRTMNGILKELEIAGASIAIWHRGQPVLSRGYGLADVERQIPVKADTLFSTASVSKPFTGVGVLKLVGEGRLTLDTPIVDILKDLEPLPGKQIVDPRFRRVTVHHLLYHAGGFPHDVPVKMEGKEGEYESEEKAVLMYRKALGMPLEFDPGSTHKYSNFGFIVLRLVIERVAGQPYEPYIQQQVLRPMGVERMQMEHAGDYLPDETHRYKEGGRKPANRQAANWLAPAGALARFASAVAGSDGSTPFLGSQVTQQMLALPPGIQANRNGGHVGLGWDRAEQLPGGFQFSKNGGKAGVRAWLEHLPYRVDWAVLFNTNPPDKRDVLGETRKRLLPIFERKFAGG
ncbi:MAG TPA: serine hydrolase domain-containing protein [Pirellulales bacterium]|nr:serine hydrolase domain-containing protein [Pirellulales bacterium]